MDPSPPRPAIGVSETEPGRSDNPANLLVVDDDEGWRYIVSNCLRRAGHTVFEAHSYDAALRVIEGPHPIGAMLTDVRLPTVHGFALARMARHRRPRLKVLYMTGFPDSVQADFEEHETDTVLYKPLSTTGLVAAVEAELRRVA